MLAPETVTEKRSRREVWQPLGLPVVGPLWAWPPRPLMTLRWLVTNPGYLLPWNTLFFVMSLGIWAYLTPELSRAVSFNIDCIVEVYARNLGLMVLFIGAWRLWLFGYRGQGTQYKYNSEWLTRENPTFLWANQFRDNAFWTIVSGITVWTAYETFILWAYANGFIIWLDWRTEPVAFALIFLAIPVWREIHGYFIYRFLHWPLLYRHIHYLHHRYFECNYGVPQVPFEKWFATYHDRSPEAHHKMQVHWRKNRASA